MNTQNKEDIKALKKRNIKLKFIVGLTGSGKRTQANKIQQEFGMVYISTSELVHEEVKKNTALGSTLQEHITRGTLIPTETIVYILIRKLINTKGNTFVVSGFPSTLEQALYIEKHLQEIKFILYFNLPEDKAILRINEKYKNELSEDGVERKLNEFKQVTLPMINFYRKFGIIRDVNADGNVNQVNRSLKESLLPEVYCIIGKRYSGKTTLGRALSERMNMKYFSFKEFLETTEIKKRKNDDEFIITNFLNLLREENNRRVIIEDFPQTENQYNLFVKNGKAIKKVYYFNTEDYIVNERMLKMGKDHPNYIGCTKLKEELDSFKVFNPGMFLKKVSGLVTEFNVNNYFNLDFNRIVESIQPKIVMFGGEDGTIKDSLMGKFIDEEGYCLLDVSNK